MGLLDREGKTKVEDTRVENEDLYRDFDAQSSDFSWEGAGITSELGSCDSGSPQSQPGLRSNVSTVGKDWSQETGHSQPTN